MRRIPVILAALVMIAGTAQAQVAAPSLVPTAPRVLDPTSVPAEANFTPANPAAMQWGAPSRVGIGTLRSRLTSDAPNTDDLTYQGNYGGARLVGESLSLGAEVASISEVESTFALDNSSANAALAAQFGGWMAFGVGYASNTIEFGNSTDESTTPSGGVSLRLGESFFVGGALGEQSLSHSDDDPLSPDFEASRRVEWYGVGFRTGGDVLFHAEINVENRRHYEINGRESGGYRVQQGVLELNVWNILLAARAGSVDTKIKGKSPLGYTAADIGWAPLQGLALMLHVERLQDDDTASGYTDTFETTAASVAYQF